ncbi:hypothetical protein SAMN02910343_01584 [Dialister histaminiformans]|uniref:N-6 DNA Methylase n=2 Tax=Allisonella histaminiformans TaxID=209880 RepID=A0A1G5WSZ5_9FIRM|nr:hypothetical protein SAMN02910343_01584 [Allisonella histaminiformans]
MSEMKLIKSSERVRTLGEVFTPRRIVELMLDQPEITAKINDLSATFLEPSAGEGAFLVEILRRKMDVALHRSHSVQEYGDNALIALSSLYGIEFMEDNVEMLVMNMNEQFLRSYYQGLHQLQSEEEVSHLTDENVLKSAKTLIQANMAQGNALTQLNSDGKPIMFSEWKLLGKQHGYQYVQRLEYTFTAIIEHAQEPVPETPYEEVSLFAPPAEKKSSVTREYTPCRLVDVYKTQSQNL